MGRHETEQGQACSLRSESPQTRRVLGPAVGVVAVCGLSLTWQLGLARAAPCAEALWLLRQNHRHSL